MIEKHEKVDKILADAQVRLGKLEEAIPLLAKITIDPMPKLAAHLGNFVESERVILSLCRGMLIRLDTTEKELAQLRNITPRMKIVFSACIISLAAWVLKGADIVLHWAYYQFF